MLNADAVWQIAKGRGIDSLAELARLSKIDRTYLGRILSGERPSQPSHVLALAKALRCSPLALMGPEDPKAAIIRLAREYGVTAADLAGPDTEAVA